VEKGVWAQMEDDRRIKAINPVAMIEYVLVSMFEIKHFY
jgi:hypothetical protein